ncbi:MAG: leucine-rich repeat protein, partial [Kiritimatiellales bacterium]
KTYTVTVTRAASSVATLSNLTLSSGTLSPAFASGTTNYTADVPNATSAITVTPTVTDSNATVTVNGTTVSSGATSPSIALSVGTNIITILVTAQDASTKTYTVAAIRDTASVPTLSGLTLSGGLLNPAFNPDITNYEARVLNSATAVRVTPAVLDSGASITVNGMPVNSGTVSPPIFISAGNRTITIVVTAQSGASISYRISFLQWENGKAYAWGYNGFGHLGNGDFSGGSSFPIAVGTNAVLSGKTIAALGTGRAIGMALCTDGTFAAWGDNSYGQLGDIGNYSLIPIDIAGSGALSGKTVTCATAGDAHSLALCSDGTLAAWGDNSYGQLGNNSGTGSNVPVDISASGVLTGKTVIAVAGSLAHSLALCSDGTLAAWGRNDSGELGNGTLTGSSVPVEVDMTGALSNKTVTAVAVRNYFNLALCSDGTLVWWGHDGYVQKSNPVDITGSGVLTGKTVVAIASGNNHSLALCSDGTLAAWGDNSYGQLGDGSKNNSSIPIAVDTTGVLSGKTIVAISGSLRLSAALCTDGTLATWGYNYSGQLGNNSTTDSSVPVTVSTASLGLGQQFVAMSAEANAEFMLAVAAAPLPLYSSRLSELTLSAGELNPAFTSTMTNYTTGVFNAVDSVTVTSAAEDSNATVTVNGTTVASGAVSPAIPLVAGTNLITIIVTAQDNSTTIYTITVTRASLEDSMPQITGQPAGIEKLIGATATFTVTVAGAGPLAYQWQFNGTNLLDGSDISGATTNLLTLANAQMEDAGGYSVVVSNVYGSVTSSVAALTVITDPLIAALDGSGLVWTTGGTTPWFSQTANAHDGVDAARSGAITHSQESWVETALNSSGTLTFWWKVSSESGYDFLEFYLDGVRRGDRISGEIDWNQCIETIPAGTHTVRWRYVKDGSENRGEDAAWLDEVIFTADAPEPQITEPPLSCTNVIGSTAMLSVTAAGASPLTYQWRFNGADLFDGGDISGATTNLLTLANVQMEDAGGYSVVVSNAYGSVTSSVAAMTVVEAPEYAYTIYGAEVEITGYLGTNTAVVIPSLIDGRTVIGIGNNAFSAWINPERRNLTDVTIPDSVTYIGWGAFYQCAGLTNVVIGTNVGGIDSQAFSECTALRDITIPDRVTSIGMSAFSGCSSLTNVILGSSVSDIRDYAFAGCTNLTGITFPESLTTIQAGAFSNCGLTNAAVGTAVTVLWYNSFGNCGNLTFITVSADNPNYSSLDGVLFDKERHTLMTYPGGKAGGYIVPVNVLAIGTSAFSGCNL